MTCESLRGNGASALAWIIELGALDTPSCIMYCIMDFELLVTYRNGRKGVAGMWTQVAKKIF